MGGGSSPKRSISSSLRSSSASSVLAVGKPLVDHQPLMHARAIVVGQQCWRVQVYLGGDTERFVEIGLARLERTHGLIEHLAVQREPDLLHLARLVVAEHFTGAADLEIMHRQIEAGAEVFELVMASSRFFASAVIASSPGISR